MALDASPTESNEYYTTVVTDIVQSEREYLGDIKYLTDTLLVSLRRSKK